MEGQGRVTKGWSSYPSDSTRGESQHQGLGKRVESVSALRTEAKYTEAGSVAHCLVVKYGGMYE